MTSANDIVWSMAEFMRLWHSIVVAVTMFGVMFCTCTVVKLHNMAKEELDEMCISTSGRDCESVEDKRNQV